MYLCVIYLSLYDILSSNDLINLMNQLLCKDCVTLSLNLNSAYLKRTVQTFYVGYKELNPLSTKYTCIIQIVIYEKKIIILSNDRIMTFE